MSGLVTKSGNDRVYTPKYLAEIIVNHFHPVGIVLEPCAGRGVFVDLMPGCDWCEIDKGLNFFNYDGVYAERYDWIVTNPPWSKFKIFLIESMKLADNIVFLSLLNAFFMKARVREIIKHGFWFKEILMLKEPTHKEWPRTGFQLAATHIKKGYSGNTKITFHT